MLDLPLPFSPVIALKYRSKLGTVTLWAYDLNPSIVTSSIYILDRVDYLSQLCTGVCGSTHAALITSACHYIFDRDKSRTAQSTT